jgi:hypothetical protein
MWSSATFFANPYALGLGLDTAKQNSEMRGQITQTDSFIAMTRDEAMR